MGHFEGQAGVGTSQTIRGSHSSPPLARELRAAGTSVRTTLCPPPASTQTVTGRGNWELQDRGCWASVKETGSVSSACSAEDGAPCDPVHTRSPPSSSPLPDLTHKPGLFCLPRCKGGGACKPEQHTCLSGENRSLIRHLQQSLHTRVYTQTFQFPHRVSEHVESRGTRTQPHAWALVSPPLPSWDSAFSGSLASALQFPRSLCL